jgi:hypothetical protein
VRLLPYSSLSSRFSARGDDATVLGHWKIDCARAGTKINPPAAPNDHAAKPTRPLLIPSGHLPGLGSEATTARSGPPRLPGAVRPPQAAAGSTIGSPWDLRGRDQVHDTEDDQGPGAAYSSGVSLVAAVQLRREPGSRIAAVHRTTLKFAATRDHRHLLAR